MNWSSDAHDFANSIKFVEQHSNLDENMLTDFISTLPLITYYHNTYYDVVVSLSRRFSSLVSKKERSRFETSGVDKIHYDLDNLRDKPRKKVRKAFLEKVQDDLNKCSSDARKSLDRFGINNNTAGYFFDYITNLKIAESKGKKIRKYQTIPHPFSHADVCCYSLGCIQDLNQKKLAFQADHALADTIGGDILQPMCSIHNRQKQDNLIFDNYSFLQLLD
ncbi:MAG: hypothetical protein ACPHUK_06525 [Candidatus Poseidoniaceae archaeon]